MSAVNAIVVDYGMGNLRSVSKALERVGAAVAVTNDPASIRGAERLVLPGVGAFGKAVSNLEEGGLKEAVRDFLSAGRPFLGILSATTRSNSTSLARQTDPKVPVPICSTSSKWPMVLVPASYGAVSSWPIRLKMLPQDGQAISDKELSSEKSIGVWH